MNIEKLKENKKRHLAIKISKFFNKKIILRGIKIAKGSTKHRCPNILKITKLGFRQKCNLSFGLHKTIDWYS